MTDDARMTMKSKMLRAFVASVAGLIAAAVTVSAGGQSGAATACQRSVGLDPQATVSETASTLTFTVHTGACAAAGYVSYVVTDGTARRPSDFQLSNGVLQWGSGDTSSRKITATITADTQAEILLEEFTITLVNPGPQVRVAAAASRGRIFDNDNGSRAATVDGRTCLVGQGQTVAMTPTPPPPDPQPLPCGTIEPGNIRRVPVVNNLPNATGETVFFQTSDGDLIANVDYVPVSRTVYIPPGVTTVYVDVVLLPRAFTQSGKYLNVTISNYSTGAVVAGTSRVTVWR
jgi:hypothetical protein